MKKIVEMWNRVSLIAKILVGIVIGAVLGLLVPGATGIGLIGTMFVRALKAIADTGVCPCHQLNCKCRKGKWPAVPYGDDHVYAQHAMRSGSGGERKFYFPCNHDTGP